METGANIQEKKQRVLANKIKQKQEFFKSLVFFLMVGLLFLINYFMPEGNVGIIWILSVWFIYLVYKGLRVFTHFGEFNDENKIHIKPAKQAKQAKPKAKHIKK